MSTVWYDDAVPAFARLIVDTLGEVALRENLLLRDASGLLTFVVIKDYPQAVLEKLAIAASTLHPYVDRLPVATPDQLFDDSLRDEDAGTFEWVSDERFTGWVRVLERRIGGNDWLREPAAPIPGVPPVIVFASLKGGVGRSTALAVTAAHLAAKGNDVAAVDLDLEAPGLGTLLLPDDLAPRFGTLDFFVENGLHETGSSFLEAMIAVSPLTTGRGLVHVVPAVGTRCDQAPQNVLGKLSRAYLEDLLPDQAPKTFLDQTRDLVRLLSDHGRYDAILIDARAGLNESAAAGILGLGAHTLLFGVQTPQTFRGYRYLLGALGRYRGLAETRPGLGEWRARLRMVHAKAAADPKAWKRFRDDAYELFADTLYDEVDGDSAEGSEPFNFDRDVDAAPHTAWLILNDSNYAEFDPPGNPQQLEEDLYQRTFGNLLAGIDGILSQGAVDDDR